MKKPLSLYWKCQIIGWSVASMYWGLMGLIGTNFSIILALLHFIGDLLIYITPTHFYRNFSVRHQWHTLSPKSLLIRIIPAVILLGFTFMVLTVLKTYLVRLWLEPGFSETFRQYADSHGPVTFVTGIRLMSIWVLAYYLYHYAQREITATRESDRLAIIAKDAQLNHLAAQLNPHFFFNSLNNIKALVIENPHAARRSIDLLSDLLRTSLYDRKTALISLKEEMTLINDYLELEKMRFEKRLHTVIEVDDRFWETLVLPLSIQTLVENAIKHGIAQRKSGGTIHIRVEQKDEFLKTTIQNPGKLNADQSKGLGIKNLTERLRLQFNGKAAFQLTEQPDDTVLATILTPLT